MLFSVKARCLVADDEEGRRLDSHSHPGIAPGSPAEDPPNKRPNNTSNSDLTSSSPSTRHTSTCRLGPLAHSGFGEAVPPPTIDFSPPGKTSRTVVLPPLCEAEVTEASAAVISAPGTGGPVSLAATTAVADVWGRESWYFEPTAPPLVDTKVRGHGLINYIDTKAKISSSKKNDL
jgi:hypothetical protein